MNCTFVTLLQNFSNHACFIIFLQIWAKNLYYSNCLHSRPYWRLSYCIFSSCQHHFLGKNSKCHIVTFMCDGPQNSQLIQEKGKFKTVKSFRWWNMISLGLSQQLYHWNVVCRGLNHEISDLVTMWQFNGDFLVH